MPRLLASALLVLFLAVPAAPAQQFDVLLGSLEPVGHLNDFAGVAGPQSAAIEGLLTELEQKTGSQVAVVTLDSLEGGEMSDFAVRLFERWGIGGADQDDGVLLIAAIAERDVRIEVGYGLEGVINDAAAGRILDTAVLPYFREEDYPSGLAAGAVAIASRIAEEAGVQLTGAPAVGAQGGEGRSFGLLRFLFLLLLLPVLWRNPWLFLLLMSGGRGGFGGGGGFGRGGGGGFGGFGGGMSGGGGAGRSW